jgi:hypothetical protein
MKYLSRYPSTPVIWLINLGLLLLFFAIVFGEPQ